MGGTGRRSCGRGARCRWGNGWGFRMGSKVRSSRAGNSGTHGAVSRGRGSVPGNREDRARAAAAVYQAGRRAGGSGTVPDGVRARKGSVAAPTAGLHFTPEVIEACRARGRRWRTSRCTWGSAPSAATRGAGGRRAAARGEVPSHGRQCGQNASSQARGGGGDHQRADHRERVGRGADERGDGYLYLSGVSVSRSGGDADQFPLATDEFAAAGVRVRGTNWHWRRIGTRWRCGTGSIRTGTVCWCCEGTVGQTIGFCRLPTPRRFSRLADHKKRWSAPPCFLVLRWAGDGAFGGRRDQRAILGEDAGLVARGARLPRGQASGQLRGGNVQIHYALVGINCDLVAFLDDGDGAAVKGFGATWAIMKPWVAPLKRPSSPAPRYRKGRLRQWPR